MIETIALGITAFTLIILNIALNKKNSNVEINEREMQAKAVKELDTEVYSPYYFPVEERSEREKELYKQGKEINSRIKEILQTIDFLNKKQNIINQRITSIENKLRKVDLSNNNNNANYFAKKIEKLEDFRRNTIIEIEALKQSLKDANKISTQLKKESSNIDAKIDRKMHELVFHSKK